MPNSDAKLKRRTQKRKSSFSRLVEMLKNIVTDGETIMNNSFRTSAIFKKKDISYILQYFIFQCLSIIA